jgi:predicted GNAT family N-acyltransferase
MTKVLLRTNRLTRKDEDVPVEVMAADIFRVARVVTNDPAIRGNKLRRKVIETRIHELYPEVPQEKFVAALAYLAGFLRDDD